MWLASYARKSRALGDPDHVDVVAHQLAHSDRIAGGMGYQIPPENRIAEVGSGESLTRRPRFCALLDELEATPPPAGGILWVPEVARLTRADPEEFGKIMRVLRTANVKVCVAGRLLDLRDPDDEQWFTWQAASSRHEVQVYKRRVSVKLDQLLEEGRIRNGGDPFGYRWIPGDWIPGERRRHLGHLEPHPVHFPILVACCREVLHTSVTALAKRYQVPFLNLYNALKNPTICGWPSIHKHEGHRLPREQWRWAGQENTTYPHACTRAHWEAIQEAIAGRARRHERTETPEAWCRDLIRFIGLEGEHYLTACRWMTLAGPVSRRIYALRDPARPTRWLAYIERERVHRAVEEKLFALFRDPEAVVAMVDAYRAEREAREREKQAAEQSVARELRRLQRRYQEAVEREFDAEEPLRSALATRRLRLETEMALAERQLLEEQRTQERASTVDQLLLELLRLSADFEARWRPLSDPERRGLVRAIVAEVRVRCERVGALLRVREVEEVVLQPWFRHSARVEHCTGRYTHGEFRQMLFTVKRAKL